MNDARLARTRQQLQAKSLDGLALVPGPNLLYVTGLSLHLSERPSVFILRSDGTLGIIAPSFEAPRVAQALGPAVQVFPWTDEQGHADAFLAAAAAMGLAGAALAIEYLQMRAGAVSPGAGKIYRTVLAANRAGCARAGPDVACAEVDRAARKLIDDAGYGPYFTHRTGHGLGLESHEPPYIVAGNETPLEPGMIFTVEPGIYIEGQAGVRIEDNLVCTETGVEVLTTFERHLIHL